MRSGRRRDDVLEASSKEGVQEERKRRGDVGSGSARSGQVPGAFGQRRSIDAGGDQAHRDGHAKRLPSPRRPTRLRLRVAVRAAQPVGIPTRAWDVLGSGTSRRPSQLVPQLDESSVRNWASTKLIKVRRRYWLTLPCIQNRPACPVFRIHGSLRVLRCALSNPCNQHTLSVDISRLAPPLHQLHPPTSVVITERPPDQGSDVLSPGLTSRLYFSTEDVINIRLGRARQERYAHCAHRESPAGGGSIHCGSFRNQGEHTLGEIRRAGELLTPPSPPPVQPLPRL